MNSPPCYYYIRGRDAVGQETVLACRPYDYWLWIYDWPRVLDCFFLLGDGLDRPRNMPGVFTLTED